MKKLLVKIIAVGLIVAYITSFNYGGCGGLGGGKSNSGSSGDTTPPAIWDVTPLDLSIGLELNTVVSATFSEALDSATVNNSTFTLVNKNGSVTGTAAYSAASSQYVVSFTPSVSLSENMVYTATISTGVKDASGNALATAKTWAFKTLYGNAMLIGDVTGTPAYPRVWLDASGNAIAVWAEQPASRTQIYKNRYVSGTGWANLGTQLDTDISAAGSDKPRVSMASSGQAVAIWSQGGSDMVERIYYNVFTPGSGWSGPALIDSGATTTYAGTNPDISLNFNTGDAVAVWGGTNLVGGLHIYASHYVSGTGWSAIEQVSAVTSTIVYEPFVWRDPYGNAFAAWIDDSTPKNLYVNRYSGASWGTPQLMETSSTGDALNPRIGLHYSGDAMLVWGQDNNINAIRYVSPTGWATAQVIGTSGSAAASAYEAAKVMIDPSGNALAIWSWNETATPSEIRFNRFNGATWGTQAKVDNSGGMGGVGNYPAIGMDSSGNAIAVWLSMGSLAVSRYKVGTGWSMMPTLVGSSYGASYALGTNRMPQIRVDANGRAVAVFVKSELAGYGLWAVVLP